MKFLRLLLLPFLFCSELLAQEESSLEINNLSAFFHASGMLFNNPSFDAHSYFPSSSSKTSIYMANLVLGGKDESGANYVASQTYHLAGRDFSTGPISSNYSEEYETKYNRVWKVSLSQIQTHIINFASPLYTMPDGIVNWPGNGNIANGESEKLAPFVDFNNNDIYDPSNGDYPLIRGQEAILFMLNDDRGHGQTGGSSMGLEIIGMAYAFAGTAIQPALGNTIFVNYTIRNASGKKYSEFRMASFIDFDLGYYLDDILAWSPELNMLYTYNGDENDEGATGYGENPPAQGLVFLDNTNMTSIYEGPINPNRDIFYTNVLANEGTFINAQGPGDVSGLVGSSSTEFESGAVKCFDMAFVFAQTNSGGAQGSVQQLENDAQAIKTVFENANFDCAIDNIGLSDNLKPSILIYPNPAKRQVNVDLRAVTEDGTIQILNMRGAVVSSSNILKADKEKRLSLKNLPSGIYVIEVRTNTILHSQKLIVQ